MEIAKTYQHIFTWRYTGGSVQKAFRCLEGLHDEVKDMDKDMTLKDVHVVIIFLGLCNSEYKAIAEHLMSVPCLTQSSMLGRLRNVESGKKGIEYQQSNRSSHQGKGSNNVRDHGKGGSNARPRYLEQADA